MPEAVSAVLLNWKRPENIPAIVASLVEIPQVTEVICWDNSCTLDPATVGCKVIQPPDGKNWVTYGRFVAASLAVNRLIITQDDDCIVRNFPELLARFDGKRITAGLTERHYRAEAGRTPWVQMGWGSLLRREWILPAFEPYLKRWGSDELLHRKADRIFTAMHGLHDPVPADVELLRMESGIEYGRDPNSLWLMADHRTLTDQAMKRVRELKKEAA